MAVLVLPGYGDSGPAHWQTLWEARHGYTRVVQADWLAPQRDDWVRTLEHAVRHAPPPVTLVAHSLGCILTAWWAAHSANAHRVVGALLVAPGDVERPDLAAQIHGWAPIARQPLPFPAVLVGSRNDPYCSFERAQALGQVWGARFIDYGERGHINAESGLGDWDEGHAWLHELAGDVA